MAATLKMKLFLVVLAFGFFTPPQVDGGSATLCISYKCPFRPSASGQLCKIKDECKGVSDTCEKIPVPQPHRGASYKCSTSKGSDEVFLPDSTCISGNMSNDEVYEVKCQCFKDNCNSVGRLHGWTFIQLIAIFFFLVKVTKP